MKALLLFLLLASGCASMADTRRCSLYIMGAGCVAYMDPPDGGVKP